MRHTYSVAMLSGTWGYEPRSMEFVSAQLGHAEITTTQRYYGAFEAGTWAREARQMAGRAPLRSLAHVVTAAELLGIDAPLDASHPRGEPKKASGAVPGENPRHSPRLQEIPRKTELAALDDATSHHSMRALGEALLRAAAADDHRAFGLAADLADRVHASRAVQLANSIVGGGPHLMSWAIELAQLVVESGDWVPSGEVADG